MTTGMPVDPSSAPIRTSIVFMSGCFSWRNSFLFNRLSLLNEYGNNLFLEMLELSFDKTNKLPKELSKLIRQLSLGIESKDGETIEIDVINKKEINKKYHKFLDIIYDAEAIINLPFQEVLSIKNR